MRSTRQNIIPYYVNSLVIGAGPSGLATAYCLKQVGISYTVLEASNRVANSWHFVWNNFELAQPVSEINMVGLNLQQFDGNYRLKKTEIIEIFSNYAKSHELTIIYNITVASIEKNSFGTYLVKTNEGQYIATNIIISIGARQQPRYPICINENFRQLYKDKIIHSAWFQGNYNLPQNASILIIGGGLSALTIAKNFKLTNVSYRVTIACHYEDDEIAKNNKHIKSLPTTLFELRRLGVIKIGKLIDARDGHFFFSNPTNSIPIDTYSKIIFATGYTFVYDKICSLLKKNNVEIYHHDGVTKEAGLYLAGIPANDEKTVTLNQGSIEAENIARHICKNKRKSSLIMYSIYSMNIEKDDINKQKHIVNKKNQAKL